MLRSPVPATLLAATSLALSACASVGTTVPEGRTPERIILFIADGAGTAHWTLASYADPDHPVHRMKTVGLIDTRGADHTVSGSAPTATAYATGVRSYMGAVGVGPDGEPRESVVEVAMARGMSTGLMTTTFIADATPAAFGAHARSRTEIANISRQMATKGITVLMGGGRRGFLPESQPDSSDLLAELRDDYTYVSSIEELKALDLDTVPTLLGLFADVDMGVVAERGDALPTMTEAALEILDRNPNGFFLMVENEESDTQAHQNADQATITEEMIDIGRAISIALDYQRRHPETLVIATGDHETGGISLTYDQSREIVMRYASGAHTGTLIPLFATGPGAERFAGVIRNDEVGRILLSMVRGR